LQENVLRVVPLWRRDMWDKIWAVLHAASSVKSTA
jgi:hypothetical protein